jgi:uncharacterized protein YqeY
VSIDETIKADMMQAMKAGEKARASALRLVLSELQKAAKDGDADELAVLRRERKRRTEAAEQFEAAGREDLAGPERSEAEMITTYLPAGLSEAQLKEIVATAVSSTGASGPGDIGQVMQAAMAAAQGRADGKAVNALVREALGG